MNSTYNYVSYMNIGGTFAAKDSDVYSVAANIRMILYRAVYLCVPNVYFHVAA